MTMIILMMRILLLSLATICVASITQSVQLTSSMQRHLVYMLADGNGAGDGAGGNAGENVELVGADADADADAILLPDEKDNCPAGYFHCNTTAQCVPQRANCDGSVDCDDGSDEWNCVNEVDAKYWDHLFRKNPFGRQGMDDKPIGDCSWLNANFSCPCRGYEILCRFQQLTTLPAHLPNNNLVTLDLTGNSFDIINESFFSALPEVESLVLKLCSIREIASHAFDRLAAVPLKTLYMDDNKLSRLPEHFFAPGNQLRLLILARNRLSSLNAGDFRHLQLLEELDLRGNLITEFGASVFGQLQNLEVLYLNENRLQQLQPGMFPTNLQHLHTLSLAQNQITSIAANTFTFPHLRHLFLAGNQLSHIRDGTFCNLSYLQGLHLNENRIEKFDLHAFDCLENLSSLLLTGNRFKTLDPAVLQNLSSLDFIYFSWFHLCRAAMHVRVCDPRGDGISSTFHLLDNQLLRGSVWVMASIAVVGNLLVLLGRYFYKSRSNVEHSLYLRHLAASDFLMGIYLTLIACADINFRGQYIRHEESWRHSGLCAFAGFLSTFSCQSSTLLLTLVTWDRLMSVTRPLKPRDAEKFRIVLRLLLVWGMSFILAAAPLMPNDYFGEHFYGNNGVCLSLHIHDPYAKGWEYSALLFICINTMSLVFILFSYVRMLQAIRDSGGGMRSTHSGRESVVATRFAIIVTTDCACWLPIIVVKIAALSGCVISPDLYAWLAVLVLPVNSALNPVLYTLTTAAFKQQLRRYCHTLPSCSLGNNETRSQTQTAYESGLSVSLAHMGGGAGGGGGGGGGGIGGFGGGSGRKHMSHRHMSYL
ncbi:relaxin receptor 2 isoform X1 [Drosophila albomicans]|uniref:Relaxin receptor 2 isoform X1 n=1 Tax=Drosophila albomicans TaxID=7291 RepID=A0A6P8WSW9_DROAB|nr:relaxin receptor 2 isoform X1 [Drosophila albomicans]